MPSDAPDELAEERAALEATIRAAAQAGDYRTATTRIIHGYGDEILGFLVAMTRSEADAQDAFSFVCEAVWKHLATFRWASSCRTWLYTLARSGLGRIGRDPYGKRKVVIDDAGIEALVQAARSRTATFLRTESKDRLAEIRATLAPDEQALLILRINRGLEWRDIAAVLASEDGEELDDAQLARESAALRKRFERLKERLRERMQAGEV